MIVRTRTAAVLAALAAAAILGGTGTTAAAAPPQTLLSLTFAVGAAPTPVTKQAVLRCEPSVGSTHPRAGTACVALRRVDGDFTALNVASGACSMEYAPVTVTANGTWRSRAVRFQRTFSNACFLRLKTGPVYRF